jgi:hypothetical protein
MSRAMATRAGCVRRVASKPTEKGICGVGDIALFHDFGMDFRLLQAVLKPSLRAHELTGDLLVDANRLRLRTQTLD